MQTNDDTDEMEERLIYEYINPLSAKVTISQQATKQKQLFEILISKLNIYIKKTSST